MLRVAIGVRTRARDNRQLTRLLRASLSWRQRRAASGAIWRLRNLCARQSLGLRGRCSLMRCCPARRCIDSPVHKYT